jgi:hypothetical protein
MLPAGLRPDHAALQVLRSHLLAPQAGAAYGVLRFGDTSVAACLPAGGLALGNLHEIGARGPEAETGAVAAGFAACLLAGLPDRRAVFWIAPCCDLHVPARRRRCWARSESWAAWPRAACSWPAASAAPLASCCAAGPMAVLLCTRLEAARREGLGFVATFFRVDDARPAIAIGTALPTRNPMRIAGLLGDQLEQVDPGFGIEAVVPEATATAPLAPPQMALPHTVPSSAIAPDTALADTVDELANRLGPARLWRAAPQESDVPERSVRRAPPVGAGAILVPRIHRRTAAAPVPPPRADRGDRSGA